MKKFFTLILMLIMMGSMTITSKAVTNGVDGAVIYFNDVLKGGQ